jgi:hypothetical protein
MNADYLRQCLFLYPDWDMFVEIDGERKPLLSVTVDSEKQEIVLEGGDSGKNRDVG